jgi:hypothetical protein
MKMITEFEYQMFMANLRMLLRDYWWFKYVLIVVISALNYLAFYLFAKLTGYENY